MQKKGRRGNAQEHDTHYVGRMGQQQQQTVDGRRYSTDRTTKNHSEKTRVTRTHLFPPRLIHLLLPTCVPPSTGTIVRVIRVRSVRRGWGLSDTSSLTVGLFPPPSIVLSISGLLFLVQIRNLLVLFFSSSRLIVQPRRCGWLRTRG